VVDKHLARPRQAHAARASLHELGTALALEGGDVLAHGGLGEVEGLRRGRERAPRGDLAQHSHPAYVEH
jgi:hypothetical protein